MFMASSANINNNNDKVPSSNNVRESLSTAEYTSDATDQDLNATDERKLTKENKQGKKGKKQNVLLEDGFKLEKQKGDPSKISILSKLPWDDDEDDEESPDSQIELSMAFAGSGNQLSPNAFKKRKKKLVKKRSDKPSQIIFDSSCQASPVPSKVDTGVAPTNEFVVNKLERIYKPLAGDINSKSQENNLNVRLVSKQNADSSDDEEKEPSRTEYYIRTVDPNHNNFEMTSQGVQTDWSWLRERSQLEKHELDGLNIEEVMERLKFGLYGGFAPNPGKKSFICTKNCLMGLISLWDKELFFYQWKTVDNIKNILLPHIKRNVKLIYI